MSSRTHFLGLRSDVPNILKAADIAVHSSYWEGLTLSILEEMAAGCPVIASDSKGISKIVEGAGILFKTGDEKDLASKIMILLDNKKIFRETLAKCKERADEFDKLYPSVNEWLGYIKDAKYVITNSFHGMAFSIVFEK